MRQDLLDGLYASYPDILKDSRGLESIGDGWYGLVERLLYAAHLERLRFKTPAEASQIKLNYIKEKFGALSVFMAGGTGPLWHAIAAIEAESRGVCEFCGSRENVSCDTRSWGWIKRLCQPCHDKRRAERAERVAGRVEP